MVERGSGVGFGIEVLLSERHLRDALLAQVEAGLLPLELQVTDRRTGLDLCLSLHPPADRELHYPPGTGATPTPADGSFRVTLLSDDPDGADLELTVVADLRDDAGGWAGGGLEVGLLFALVLTADLDEAGFEVHHRLCLSLLALDPMTQLALSFVGVPTGELVDGLKDDLDRALPLDLARGRVARAGAPRVVRGDQGRPAALVVPVSLVPCVPAQRAAERADLIGSERGAG
jgi:hypothetical protein